MQARFEYTITDPSGLHARPTGLIVSRVQSFPCEVTITCNGKSASLKKLLAVMGLGIRCGDTVTVTLEGKEASERASELKNFFEKNF